VRLSIVWTARAEKDRGQLDAPTRERIIGAIERFAETGVGDVKALAGPKFRGTLRLRVGDWRVFFSVDRGVLTILVLRVLHRREGNLAPGARRHADALAEMGSPMKSPAHSLRNRRTGRTDYVAWAGDDDVATFNVEDPLPDDLAALVRG
jgi:mRNA interferase RelE/StbE